MKRQVDFICSICKSHISYETDSFATGYATNENDGKICYECCANQDREYMRQHGKIALYLTLDKDESGRVDVVRGNHIKRHVSGKVTNWPGTLEFRVGGSMGSHNFAGVRYDVWFVFDGYVWHGVTYGNYTQICHCKKTKERAN